MSVKAVVVAAGQLASEDVAVLADAGLVVAADGGADALDRIGLRPDVLVGDLDSVSPALVTRLETSGTLVERHPIDKDSSDTELAVECAMRLGAREVVIIGATGGERLDHEIANVLLATDPRYAGSVSLARGRGRMYVLHGGDRRDLAGDVGDTVSLLAAGDRASGITTGGLRWELIDATLERGRSRGLSNEITVPNASVSVGAGTLLVIETSRVEVAS